MTDSTSEITPRLIRHSNRPDIQQRVETQEEMIEDEAPSSDKFRTNQDIVKLNREARDRVAAQLRLERERERKYKDRVTGLKNRLWFDERLKEATDKANAQENPNLAIIFYDIDNFKKFNSFYGHTGGDEILGLLKRVFRRGEDVARYGGEEIAQIVDLNDVRTEMPMSDEDKITAITDRVRTTMKLLSRGKIADFHPIGEFEEPLPKEVTFSFGVSKFQQGEDPTQFVKRASEGVLHAKNEGRNRGFVVENMNGVIQFKQIQSAA